MQKILFLILCFFSSLTLAENIADPQSLVKITSTLLSKDGKDYLGIALENTPHWHTYWKNPGSAGLPIIINVSFAKENKFLEALEWTAPQKFAEDQGGTEPIIIHGYEGRYAFFYPLSKIQLSKINQLQLEVTWLVCKDICVQGKKEHKGGLLQEFTISPYEWDEFFKKIPENSPLPAHLDIYLSQVDKNKLVLSYIFKKTNTQHIDRQRNLLTPFLVPPFSFKQEKLYTDNQENLYGRVEVEWDGEYQEPPFLLPENGHFLKPFTFKFLLQNPQDGKILVIEKNIESFTLTNVSAIESFYNKLTPFPDSKTPKAQTPRSFWLYLLLGFLGGLILNVMPCVLPVISLKLFSLANSQQMSQKKLLKHNLTYSLGILITFTVFAFILVILKSTGEQVGWGFQLQSPHFVVIMILFLFILTLNLFGLFEFATLGGKILGNTKNKEGFLGDFFSGVLATLLSTPCSAPFLGTALTFAFTSSHLVLFIIFLSIGLGLSFPFILTGFFPSFVKKLPKAGSWMEQMKRFLGLSLILTVVWLYDIFLKLNSDQNQILLLNLVLVFLFFAFYFKKHMSQKKINHLLLFIIPLILSVFLIQKDFKHPHSIPEDSNTLIWEKWSEEKLNHYKEEKRLVFIDFTADWCLTCKVNEKLFINTKNFKNVLKEYAVATLKADYTRRDESITKWLEKNGKVGVPAYFLQNTNGEIIDLGETISAQKLQEKIEEKIKTLE
ncbi:MAG: thioredoxin family protein [Bacteriovoracaceae bacterium]|nr:thioredoxin family protein [Bacteriovoracaceae bacterium]